MSSRGRAPSATLISLRGFISFRLQPAASHQTSQTLSFVLVFRPVDVHDIHHTHHDTHASLSDNTDPKDPGNNHHVSPSAFSHLPFPSHPDDHFVAPVRGLYPMRGGRRADSTSHKPNSCTTEPLLPSPRLRMNMHGADDKRLANLLPNTRGPSNH